METSHIVLLAVSASISFAIGRTIIYFRKKKKNLQTHQKAAKAKRDAPPEAASKNKSKRKRQARHESLQNNQHDV